MNKATFSFLRYQAFWTEADKNLHKYPEVREVTHQLQQDFMEQMRLIRVYDIN